MSQKMVNTERVHVELLWHKGKRYIPVELYDALKAENESLKESLSQALADSLNLRTANHGLALQLGLKDE